MNRSRLLLQRGGSRTFFNTFQIQKKGSLNNQTNQGKRRAAERFHKPKAINRKRTSSLKNKVLLKIMQDEAQNLKKELLQNLLCLI
mmetsp:Transcript_33406/g.38362  ORF Transcript_33406/g.38362 Transcript_33406/m.38362 type:complete len:86 (-) Transcript_33406:15-272(-)